MKATDFEFDGKRLSDFGMTLCKFDSGGIDTVGGVQISFNTISTLNGAKQELVGTTYEDCLETTLQICKCSCTDGIQEMTSTEHRELTKWLSRKKFLKFKILDADHIDLYFEVMFNVNKIEMNGGVIGLELDVKTNRPYALKDPRVININNTVADGKHSVNDTSYEEGYIYPHTEITVSENGNLNIYNAIEDRNTYIANCKKGEVITLDYPVISSSDSSHNIQNDFNWNFFRVANTFENSRNDLIISLPCSIKIEYSPIVKIGL